MPLAYTTQLDSLDATRDVGGLLEPPALPIRPFLAVGALGQPLIVCKRRNAVSPRAYMAQLHAACIKRLQQRTANFILMPGMAAVGSQVLLPHVEIMISPRQEHTHAEYGVRGERV